MIRCAQERFFKGELESLRRGKSVDKNSPLLKLDVFLDSSGVIRVGGRLNRLTESQECYKGLCNLC